ncbi:hypothetical protein Tco_0620362 [Tanacetum coccineum]
MSEEDEENTAFHIEERVYCHTHMPKGLKNSVATLQRMMDKVLIEKKGRNVEVYLEEKVIKNKSEQDLVQDVEETLYKLQRVNMNLDSNKCAFRMEEGKLLGYVVTLEGIKADPGKVKVIVHGSTLESPEQVQSFCLQLTNISGFIPNMAELMFPFRDIRRNNNTEEMFKWISGAKNAIQDIKKKLGKLQTLGVPREGETVMVCLRPRNKTISSVLFTKEQEAIPNSLCKSSATRNGYLLHFDRESIIGTDPHGNMHQKDL